MRGKKESRIENLESSFGANRSAFVIPAKAGIQTLILSALVLMLLCPLGASPAYAQFNDVVSASANPASKPLVLIRFNQRNIYYERQMFAAVSRAVEVKPDVMFELVSFVPSDNNPQSDGQWQQIATAHSQQVIRSLNSMGVPTSRINYNRQTQPGLRFDEVHLFAR